MARGPHSTTTHDPPPWPRAMTHAAGAILVPCVIGTLLRMSGADFVVMITATITMSILGVFVGVRSLVGRRTWPGVAAILIFSIVPFVAVNVLSEARGLGLVLHLPVEEANGQPLAAGFVFDDGAVPRSDLSEVITVVDTWSGRRNSGRRQDTYVVAPVVPPSWTPDQRVHVVAVAASRHELSRRVPDISTWSSSGGLLRLLDEELQARAVRDALKRRGLSAVGNVVVGTWVPGPGIARIHAVLPALALVSVALLVWAVILLVDRRGRPRGTRGAAAMT